MSHSRWRRTLAGGTLVFLFVASPGVLPVLAQDAAPVPVQPPAADPPTPQAPEAAPDQILIEEIQVLGLSRMTRPTLLGLLDLRVGEPFDRVAIQRSFRRAWTSGVFEDITIDAEDAPGGGKAIIIRVDERPQVVRIEFEENSVLSQTEIEDELANRRVDLKESRPLDMGEVARAQAAIRFLLEARGYLGSRVEADIRRVTESSRSVNFRISPGGKTRIRKIEFVGNELFKDKQLISSLEFTKPRRWYYPWSSKNLYFQPKWDQDVGNIRNLYESRGFLDVAIEPPVVEVRTKDGELVEPAEDTIQVRDAEPVELPPPPVIPEDASERKRRKIQKRYEKKLEKAEKKRRKQERALVKAQSKKWVHLTVRVTEGEPYTLGKISFQGNDVFKDEELRLFVSMREGDTFNKSALDLGQSSITRLYENRGYLYSTIVTNPVRDAETRVADVDVVITEGDSYTVDRIEFSGNQSTLDYVLRREVPLREAATFSRDLLDFGTRRINQLGYWQVTGEPVVEPIEENKSVGVTILGEEQGRNEIQVGGGFSGIDGAFFNGVYSTRNFLGRGQTLSTSIQIGARRSQYQISFQEPWFLNKPILLGANIFRREVEFGSTLDSSSTGFGVVVGRRVGRFSRFNVGYNYERVESDSFIRGLDANGATGETLVVTSRVELSSITPVYSFRTINNPFRPTRGQELRASVQVAGGPLGGDSSFYKPILSLTSYTPLKRSRGGPYFGQHAQLGYIGDYGDGSLTNDAIKGVPRFQRFWLGGDVIGPRVFETRTIVPRRFVVLTDDNQGFATITGDPSFLPVDSIIGGVEVGGDRFYLYQLELVFPVNEQIDIVGFFDAGDVFFEDQGLGFETTRMSAGAELRFNLPIFPVPLRLIYGVPIRELEFDRTTSFSFSVGRSF